MTSNGQLPRKVERPLIPPLTLETCETGGGWGVGEIFARLPPAQEQANSREKLYRVAKSSSEVTHSKPMLSKSAVPTPPLALDVQENNDIHPSTQKMATVTGERPSQFHRTNPSPRESLPVRGKNDAIFPIATYTHEEDEDDNTFVDHGSVSNSVYADKLTSNGPAIAVPMLQRQGRRSSCRIPTYMNTLKPNVLPNTGVNGDAVGCSSNITAVAGSQMPASDNGPTRGAEAGSSGSVLASSYSLVPSSSGERVVPKESSLPARSASVDRHYSMAAYTSADAATTVLWSPRIVSELLIDLATRDLVVSPDGGAIWAAFGDHPPTLFEVHSEKHTLESVRSVDWVTQVYCMAVVEVPIAKRITFKSVTVDEASEPIPSVKSPIKRKNKFSAKSSQLLGPSPVHASEANPCTHALWCGLSHGNISIVDLYNFTDAGVIRGAHDQAVNKIWYLENGLVWTAGRDKALKVWNPQTRRMLKKRNIAAILSDLCYVCTTHQVWAIADDAYIRVYEAGGDNVRIKKRPNDHGENTLKMRNDVMLIQYHRDGNFIWVGMSKNTALIDPHTFNVNQTLPLTLAALVFYKKTAVLCGRGPLLLDNDTDSVAILDLTNPIEPSLLFSGFHVNAPSRLGIRLLTSPHPFAILEYYSSQNYKKALCMFTYEEFNGKSLCEEENVPPQRKVKRVIMGVTPANDPVNPSTCVVSGVNSVAVGGKSTGLASIKPSLGLPLLPASSNPNNHPPAIPNSSAQRPSPTPSPVRAISNCVPMPATGYNGNFLVASAEVSLTLDQMDKKLEEVRKAVAIERREKGPLSDFSKLHRALTTWMVEAVDYAPPSLPPGVVDELSREYETPEGKALAVAFARLQCAVSGGKYVLGVGTGIHASDPCATLSRLQRVPPVCKTHVAHPTAATLLLGSSNEKVGHTIVPQTAHLDASRANAMSVLCPVRAEPSGTLIEAPLTQAAGTNDSKHSNNVEQTLLKLIKEERQSHQAQIQSLQRHNSRILARLDALIGGIEDFVSATAESYEEFKNIPTDGLPHDILITYNHFLEVLMQIPPLCLDSADSREQIVDMLRKHTTASRKVIRALNDLLLMYRKACTLATTGSGNSASALSLVNDPQYLALQGRLSLTSAHALSQSNVASPFAGDVCGSKTGALLANTRQVSSTERSPIFQSLCNEAADYTAELEYYLPNFACSSPSEDQLMRLIGEVSANIERSMYVDSRWDMLKQSRRQVLSTIVQSSTRQSSSKGSSSPAVNLSEDFMQCTAVWDLSIAEVFIKLCKDEASLVMMEALLEHRRGTQLRCSTHSPDTHKNNVKHLPATVLSLSYPQKDVSHGEGCISDNATHHQGTVACEDGNFSRLSEKSFCEKSHRYRDPLYNFAVQDAPSQKKRNMHHRHEGWLSDEDRCCVSRDDESNAVWVAMTQRVSTLSLRMESMVEGIRESLKEEIAFDQGGSKCIDQHKTTSSFSLGQSKDTMAVSEVEEKREEVGVEDENNSSHFERHENVYLGLSSPELRCFVRTRAARLDGFLHWARVGVYLTALCLNSIRALIYPTVSMPGKSESAVSSETDPPHTMDAGNFLVINKKLLDCASFLKNTMTYAHLTHYVMVGCHTAAENFTSPGNNVIQRGPPPLSHSNVHSDPAKKPNSISIEDDSSALKEASISTTRESVFMNSLYGDFAANNSKESQPGDSKTKRNLGHCHSEATIASRSDDFSVLHTWVRRDLDKRQWFLLLSFYIQLILRHHIQPELFLPIDPEATEDGAPTRCSARQENNVPMDSATRCSIHDKSARRQIWNAESRAQKLDRCHHTQRNDTSLQQTTIYLDEYSDKARMLFESASSVLEYCYQLEKRMCVIGKQNGTEDVTNSTGNRQQEQHMNEGSITKSPNTVAVSRVNKDRCLHPMDCKTIIHCL